MPTTFQSAQPYVTGAVHFFVGRTDTDQTPNAGSAGKKFGPEYMGTCEFSPRIQVDKVWVPLFNDLGGPVVPFDVSYAGKQAFISADFTRWNEEALSRFDSAPRFEKAGLKDMIEDMGTLVNTEGYNITVWAVFPYQRFPAYSTMVKGFRFPAIVGLQADHNRLGTQPRRLHLNLHAIRLFSATKKQFVLADDDMTAVAGLFP